MILPSLIIIPFIGGLLCWQAERISVGAPRWIALITMALVLALGCSLWMHGDYTLASGIANAASTSPHWQLEYQAQWIPALGISFHLGLDGLSLLMVLLTGLLGMMAVVCSWQEIQRHVGFFHLNLLWNLGGVIGVFLSLDLFLFFFFWEMMLVPMYFLIAVWGHNAPGGKGRIYAANKFFIFTQAAGLLMLLSIIGLVYVHASATHQISFDLTQLLNTPMAPAVEFVLMLGFFLAFAVKLPVVPLHSWLPDAHSQAPTAGSVDLAGVLLKTAAFGFLRFGLPLFPHASHEFAPVAMWLGVVGIVYGALMAFVQTDVKRLVAYTSVSHMGFVLIGLYSGSFLALQGVIVQMLAHGLSAGALFILCGEIYERLHTRDMREMGGLWTRLPYLPPIAMFFAAASLGLPGLGNFIGEFLILMGSFKSAPIVTTVAASGLILAAVYSLVMVQRTLYGPAKSAEKLPDLSKRELTMMLSLIVMLVAMGIYPQPILNTSAESMRSLATIYASGAPATTAAAAQLMQMPPASAPPTTPAPSSADTGADAAPANAEPAAASPAPPAAGAAANPPSTP